MITTEVHRTGETRFDQVGQSLGCQIFLTEEEISPGLAHRLLEYAKKRAHAAGLWCMIASWKVVVGADDADEPPADRSYWVAWKNDENTQIRINYILTRSGWPFLDHGFDILEDQ